MIEIYDQSLIKTAEEYTINEIGVPSMVLMERAAIFVYKGVLELAPKNVLIMCGYGNNGADGIAIARLLMLDGVNTYVVMVGDAHKISKENAVQASIYKNLGGILYDSIPDVTFDVCVDALLGIGINRELSGVYLEAVNNINKIGCKIISVDIPTGLKVDADITYTFGRAKLNLSKTHYKYKVCDVGIVFKDKPSAYAIEESDLRNLMPKRIAASHKGTYGKVLVIAGSDDMPGAAYMASKSAFNAGAGMVKLLTSKKAKSYVLSNLYECMVSTYDDNIDENIDKDILWSDICIIGPGLSICDDSRRLVEYIIKNYDKTLIIDADALNIISEDINMLKLRKGKTILTPHKAEYRRLFGDSSEEEAAKAYGVIIVSKDSRTIITNGVDTYINTSGCNGMSTAGSGDVLTGVIAAFSHNAKDITRAVATAVYVHGLAGEIMSKENNNYSLMATDIIEGIKKVLNKYESVI